MESTPVSEKSSVPAMRRARHPCSQQQAFAGARPAEQTREKEKWVRPIDQRKIRQLTDRKAAVQPFNHHYKIQLLFCRAFICCPLTVYPGYKKQTVPKDALRPSCFAHS